MEKFRSASIRPTSRPAPRPASALFDSASEDALDNAAPSETHRPGAIRPTGASGAVSASVGQNRVEEAASTADQLQVLVQKRQLNYFCFPAVAAELDPHYLDYFIHTHNSSTNNVAGTSANDGNGVGNGVNGLAGFPHQDNVIVVGPQGIGKTAKRLRLHWEINQRFVDDLHSRILVVPFVVHPLMRPTEPTGRASDQVDPIARPVLFAALLSATIRAAFAMLTQHGHVLEVVRKAVLDAAGDTANPAPVLHELRRRFDMAYKPEHWRGALHQALAQHSLAYILDDAGLPRRPNPAAVKPQQDWLALWTAQLTAPAHSEAQLAGPELKTEDQTEALQRLWIETLDLLCAIGFQKVVVMADGFESLAVGDAHTAAACVQQLIGTLTNTPTHGRQVVLQAFVPDEVVNVMNSVIATASDRNVQVIPRQYWLQPWPADDLRLLVERRLQVASNGRVHHIGQAWDTNELNLDLDALIDQARGLPLRLLQALERAFERWADNTPQLDWA